MEIKSILKEISAKHREACNAEKAAALTSYYKSLFPVDTVSLEGLTIEVNGHKVLMESDQYNNLSSKIPLIPIELLEVFATIVRDWFEPKQGYVYRLTQGFLMSYWQQNYKSLSAEDAIKMLEISDKMLKCLWRTITGTGVGLGLISPQDLMFQATVVQLNHMSLGSGEEGQGTES